MAMQQNKRTFLERFAYSPQGTFGVLTVGDFSCYTVEPPWLLNKRGESCVPEGVYAMRKRISPVVQRSSNGRYREGWEVCDVPNRTFIMIHPGNNMFDVIGCIAVGRDLGFVKSARSPRAMWAVTDSQGAFADLMTSLEVENEWDLVITQKTADYP